MKFGFIGRGWALYVLRFQNILLEQKENTCLTILTGTVGNDIIIPKESKIKATSNINCTHVEFISNEHVLNFTCSIDSIIDSDTYMQTYKVNGEILFQCGYFPNIEINTNMKETLTHWDFVDH